MISSNHFHNIITEIKDENGRDEHYNGYSLGVYSTEANLALDGWLVALSVEHYWLYKP